MKKMMISIAVASVAMAGAAIAHPTTTPYDTRGECEAAFAESSKFDRERLLAGGVVDTIGEAQRTFRDTFSCEYDQDEDAWYIVFHGFSGA